MQTPGDIYPGEGLWSTTGHAPPSPRPGVSLYVTEPPVAPALAARPISPQIQVKKPKTRSPWTCRCNCNCKCCGYDLCCPCTCCRCCFCLCVIIIVFILAIGVVVLTLWKVLRPKLPTYNVDNVKFEFAVTGAGATNVNSPTPPTSYVLNTNTIFDMELGNPNTKIGICYDQIKLNMQLFGMVIGNQIIPQFYDGYKVTKYIKGNMTSGPVTLSTANEAALATAESAGSVPLNLKIDVKVRIKLGHLVTPQLKVELNCVVGIDPGITSGSQIKGMSCKFSFKL